MAGQSMQCWGYLSRIQITHPSKLRLIIIRLYLFMWTNLNQFCYDTFLLNCYRSSLALPFAFQPYQTCPIINNFPSNQQSPCYAQKSYRETVEEIEQKSPKKTHPTRKRKIEKSRFIIKKEREDNFERKKQKKDRNLPSNICKYFVFYLYHHPHPHTILQIQNTSDASSIITSCIQKLKTHIKDNQTYIRPGLIETMCRTDLLGQRQAPIFRILFKRFISTEFRLIISMQRKLTKKEKIAYFKLGRKFIKNFTGGL